MSSETDRYNSPPLIKNSSSNSNLDPSSRVLVKKIIDPQSLYEFRCPGVLLDHSYWIMSFSQQTLTNTVIITEPLSLIDSQSPRADDFFFFFLFNRDHLVGATKWGLALSRPSSTLALETHHGSITTQLIIVIFKPLLQSAPQWGTVTCISA